MPISRVLWGCEVYAREGTVRETTRPSTATWCCGGMVVRLGDAAASASYWTLRSRWRSRSRLLVAVPAVASCLPGGGIRHGAGLVVAARSLRWLRDLSTISRRSIVSSRSKPPSPPTLGSAQGTGFRFAASEQVRVDLRVQRVSTYEGSGRYGLQLLRLVTRMAGTNSVWTNSEVRGQLSPADGR